MRQIAAILLLAIGSVVAAAQETKSPLRFVPSQAEWVIQVDRPGELIDTVEKHELFKEAQKLTGVRDLYDTTNFQQLFQLVGYFEKELGKDRRAIVDDLGAGGLVIAAKLTPPGGAMVVLQGRDAALMRRFVDLALDVIEKELERQESKDKIVRKKYEGIDVGQVGPKLSFAVHEGALIVASESKILKAALDTHLKKPGHTTIAEFPNFDEARKKAPAKALAWTWLNFEAFRKHQPFQDGLNAASLDPLQTLLFGGLTDLFKRTPYLSASITREGPDFRVSAYMPRGSDGMAPLKHMLIPTDGKATLPPLRVPRVLASTSYYLDMGQWWDKRVEILGEKNAKELDEGEANIAKALGGLKIGKVLQNAGPHHRVVVAQQKEEQYKIRPGTPIPAFALVVDMRDPNFAKDMNSIFRGGALVATVQFSLILREEEYKDCEIVSYFFSETRKVEGDPDNVRFNFSPSYVTVGDYFVMSSTQELARDLVDALKAEKKQPFSKTTMQTQLFASGLGDLIRANEDATLTQLILGQALQPKTAKAELQAIIRLIESLGTLRVDSQYGANDYRLDVLWQVKKK